MKYKLTAFVLLGCLALLNFRFTVSAQPVVTTLAATSITSSNATLNGTINPNGSAGVGYFQYGLTTDYGYLGGFTVLPAGNSAVPVPGFVANSLPGAAGASWANDSGLGYIGHWQCIASSADGIRLAAVVDGDDIFTSTNGGASFSQVHSAPLGYWYAITSSADGSHLAAAQYINEGQIWTSTDGGASWTKTGAPNYAWTCIASSADGSRLVAAMAYSSTYTSTNGGTNWTQCVIPTSISEVVSSADGMRLAAVGDDGGIWASTDGGVVWTQTSAPVSSGYNYWTCIASSADGQRLVAGQYNLGGIWTSTNGGATWAPTSAPAGEWVAMASSADGTRLAAATGTPGGNSTGNIYTSTNGGATWTATSAPSVGWTFLASSADGSRLAASADGSGVWTSAGTETDLLLATTYHYRLVGINSAGTAVGGDLTFTMPLTSAPFVVSATASGITATNVTLGGTVKTGGLKTTVYFQYGLTTGYGSLTTAISLGATNMPLSVSSLISSLAPGTTYHYQLVASNSVGITPTGDLTFTTPPLLPVIMSSPATSISATSATLNGTINPGGGATSANFQYGQTTNYGSSTATINIAAGNTTVPATTLISGLAPGTTYHFQLVGGNSAGTASGGDLTFTTSTGAPTAITLPESGVTGTGAMLHGTVTTGGFVTAAYFQYGPDTSYGTYTSTNTLAPGTVARLISIPTGPLSPLTTYHFRQVAVSSAGTALGADVAFTTLPMLPVTTTLPATGISLASATLNGSVNPNGTLGAGYFQFGLTTNYGYLGGFTPLPATNGTFGLPGFVANGLPGAAGASWANDSGLGYIGHWQCIASSADGIRLAAVVDGDDIFTSTNGGASFSQVHSAPLGYWYAITSSADGSHLAAAQYINEGQIWTSTDGGASWTKTGAPNYAWTCIASSADGSRLVAAMAYSSTYTSTNGGTNWTQCVIPTSISEVVSSADGMRLAAVGDDGGIWASTDGGVVWTQTSAPVSSGYNYWTCIASSADGQRLVAGQYNLGGIWTSTNGGATWAPTSAPAGEWVAMASSADGTRLAAATGTPGGNSTGNIYTSTNGGATWTATSAPSVGWTFLASSADGSRLAASADGSGVWTSAGDTAPFQTGTTYHYRMVGINAAGATVGSDLTFSPPILKVTGSLVVSGTAFRLVFTNTPGLHFKVLATTNPGLALSNWTILGSPLEIPAGQYQFADANVANYTTRFYVIHQVP